MAQTLGAGQNDSDTTPIRILVDDENTVPTNNQPGNSNNSYKLDQNNDLVGMVGDKIGTPFIDSNKVKCAECTYCRPIEEEHSESNDCDFFNKDIEDPDDEIDCEEFVKIHGEW